MIPRSARCVRGSMSKRSIYPKKLLAVLCLMAATTCLAQSPGAKILVLDSEQGEKRVRRPREKMPNPTSEFILKVTPQNSGSQHLVLGTETIPPGGVIPKHQHLGQDEILFLQTGNARVSLNDQDYEVHAGGMVFFQHLSELEKHRRRTDRVDLHILSARFRPIHAVHLG